MRDQCPIISSLGYTHAPTFLPELRFARHFEAVLVAFSDWNIWSSWLHRFFVCQLASFTLGRQLFEVESGVDCLTELPLEVPRPPTMEMKDQGPFPYSEGAGNNSNGSLTLFEVPRRPGMVNVDIAVHDALVAKERKHQNQMSSIIRIEGILIPRTNSSSILYIIVYSLQHTTPLPQPQPFTGASTAFPRIQSAYSFLFACL
jgi:hypothetical protein